MGIGCGDIGIIDPCLQAAVLDREQQPVIRCVQLQRTHAWHVCLIAGDNLQQRLPLVERNGFAVKLFRQQLLNGRMIRHLLHQAVDLADQCIEPPVRLHRSLLDMPFRIIFQQIGDPVVHECTGHSNNNQHDKQEANEYLIAQRIQFFDFPIHFGYPLPHGSVSNLILQKFSRWSRRIRFP
ncbi:hypothetical protein D3C73_797190 [compost metagenome]